jgi:polyhydroxybutyrate depolymerase
VAHIVYYFYEPLAFDQRRLGGIASRLDKAAANGDYDIIAAQQKIIDKELARDQKHLDKKTSLDDIANDVNTVLPMLSVTELVAGAGKAVEHLVNKFDSPKPPEVVEPTGPITAPGDYTEQIKVDGTMRSYKVHVPPEYKPGVPMPSVIMLHGISEDADSFAELTNMNAKADKEGFITIYPEGNPIMHNDTHLAWNVPNWGIFHPARHADDVAFVGDVIDSATKQLSIDPNRTYVAGFSNGGMLAQEVAAKNSDKVAAVALVGTALSGKDAEPAQGVSVIDIHGTDDPVVPYQNWDNSLHLVKMQPVSYTSQFWKKADGIDSPGTETKDGNLVLKDSVNTKTGMEVKQIGVIGGTHTWPSAGAEDLADQSFNATDEIWNFFSHHSRSGGSVGTPGGNQIMTA